MRHKNPSATRAKLLHAAAEQLGEHGIMDVTLDDVAAAAAISKGGLLHHFPTKLALLEGLAGYLAEQFIARVDHELTHEPADARGRWARAYIRATFETPAWEARLANALSAALATYPQLLGVYTSAFAALDVPPDDALPPARQLMIRLACDGLALAELSGSPPIDATLRTTLLAELMEQTR